MAGCLGRMRAHDANLQGFLKVEPTATTTTTTATTTVTQSLSWQVLVGLCD